MHPRGASECISMVICCPSLATFRCGCRSISQQHELGLLLHRLRFTSHLHFVRAVLRLLRAAVGVIPQGKG